MVRSKVKLTHIQNNSARRLSFKKRSQCVLKKTIELSTLCDVQACCIIYGPYSHAPQVSPSVEGARQVLTRFRNMPEYQQGAKKLNQESFTNEQIKKQNEKLARYQMVNYRNDMTRVMYKRMRGEGTSKASLEDLLEMVSISDEKLKKIAEMQEKFKLVGIVNPPQDGNLPMDPNTNV